MFKQEVRSQKQGVRVSSFQDLKAWQLGHHLVIKTYTLTSSFPKTEVFGLINQMRRAAVSITSNLAEGFGRQSVKEKLHFYSISHGSLTELQNQWLISKDVGFISPDIFMKLELETIELHKIITGLI